MMTLKTYTRMEPSFGTSNEVSDQYIQLPRRCLTCHDENKSVFMVYNVIRCYSLNHETSQFTI